jgi:uncharacterized iron-regulated protein
MKKFIFLITLLSLAQVLTAQNPAYKIFNAEGNEVTYENVTEDILTSDVVFFGELHNNPIAHWLELSILKDLHSQTSKKVKAGFEMFEADDQIIIDEYLDRKIKHKHFKKEAKIWPNYDTDYRPLVEYAYNNNIEVIATNIPRRYASMVARNGFESLKKLSDEGKNYIAPLPIDYDSSLPGYRKMLKMSKMHGMKSNKNLPKAQAIKDATMGWFINENLENGDLMIHFNGTYHTNNKEGIVWYLKKYSDEDLKIITIATADQKSLEKLNEKNKQLADYIIVIPEDMTKTY